MAEPDPDHRISSRMAFDLLEKAICVLENVHKLSAENKVLIKSN
jgi:hypothetical protein